MEQGEGKGLGGAAWVETNRRVVSTAGTGHLLRLGEEE
jgi:hypothetical protein